MQFKEIQLQTGNLQATKIFYQEVLELEVAAQSPEMISFRAGTSILTFIDSKSLNPVYHFAFTIPANKLKEAFDWAKERVALLWTAPQSRIADFSNWNANAFYFHDNNGNIVEFIARYSLDNAIEETFSGNSLYAVSELGIVVPDVSGFCTKLIRQYALSLFPKQAPQDHFAVLGNDEGLFIVVQDDRPWYPTTTRAKAFPFRLIFEDDLGNVHQLGEA